MKSTNSSIVQRTGWSCEALSLLWVVGGCPASDGSSAAPFYMDFASTVSPVASRVCTSFVSLETTILVASSLTKATLFLKS